MKLFGVLLVALCLCAAEAFTVYTVPQSHVSQRVLAEPGISQFPSKAVAYSAALAVPVPAPQVVYSDLPTERRHTGTKVTVHYEPIEQHGYIVRF